MGRGWQKWKSLQSIHWIRLQSYWRTQQSRVPSWHMFNPVLIKRHHCKGNGIESGRQGVHQVGWRFGQRSMSKFRCWTSLRQFVTWPLTVMHVCLWMTMAWDGPVRGIAFLHRNWYQVYSFNKWKCLNASLHFFLPLCDLPDLWFFWYCFGLGWDVSYFFLNVLCMMAVMR